MFVALGLARALDALGWGVSFSGFSTWELPVPDTTTVSVSMLPTAKPQTSEDSVLRIGWVRNATSEWTAQSHLDDFDGILASSSLSAETIKSYFDGPVGVMPIAVDPELFTFYEGTRDLDVVTTANYWGQDRGLIQTLRNLDCECDVHWYGQNLDKVPDLPQRTIPHDPVGYLEVPNLYSRSCLVLDDIAPAAREHGSHNSRVFEALAAGALVITNVRQGLDELGLQDLPVADDHLALKNIIQEHLENEESRVDLVRRLREIVLQRHTYTERAILFRDFIDIPRNEVQLRRKLHELRELTAQVTQDNERLSSENVALTEQLETALQEIVRFRERTAVRIADRISGILPRRRN